MKEAEMFKEWESQEDEVLSLSLSLSFFLSLHSSFTCNLLPPQFHLEQAKLRSKLRIESGRAKPIDLLAKYINSANDEDVDIEMQEPYYLLRVRGAPFN